MAPSTEANGTSDLSRTGHRNFRKTLRRNRWQIFAVAGTAAALPLLLLLPSVGATFTLTPAYNQGCNLNPFGTTVQYPPIGTTTHALVGPTLTGGYLNPGVSGNQTASSVNSTSSAIMTAEYMMVGPHLNTSATSCWTPAVNKVVSATFKWNVTWTPYLASACTGSASSASSYDMYVVGNFHIRNAPHYLITPISPAATVGAFAIGCGGPYRPGAQTGIFTVTTPNVAVTGGTPYDFYTAIWVYTQIQTHIPSNTTASAYSAVNWEASFVSVTCNGC